MEATQAATRRLAGNTRTQVVSLWAAHQAGQLTRSQFRAQVAAAVARANAAGVSLADIGLATEITRALGRPTAPLGLVPNDVEVDQERIGADIDRILDYDDPEDALGSWAESEPYLTVANTVQTAMVQRGIERWVRLLSGTSCPLCTGWADGIARSTAVPMVRHIGCDCIQQPVI